MPLSEKDSRYKYCPLLTTKDDKLKFCLGKACLMWRWHDDEKTDESDSGWCGLAGTPLWVPFD